MSIIICKHCEKQVDTDFDAEHEEECSEEGDSIAEQHATYNAMRSEEIRNLNKRN